MIHVHVTFLCVLSANLTNTLICSSDDTVECNGNIVKLWALNRIRALNRNKVLYLRSEHSNASFSSILCISGIPGRNTSTVPRNLSLIIIIINYLPLLLFSLPLLLLSLPLLLPSSLPHSLFLSSVSKYLISLQAIIIVSSETRGFSIVGASH